MLYRSKAKLRPIKRLNSFFDIEKSKLWEYFSISHFAKVLEMEEGKKLALVERAACYLKIGKSDLALADAEESLKENKEYTRVY